MTSPTNSWRRRLLMTALALLAVVAGSVIGSGLTIITMRNAMFPRPPHPDVVASTLLERMSSLFDMTDDETGRVREIIDRRMKEVKRIRQVSFDEIRQQFDSMRKELSDVLGTQRAEAWETFLRDQRQRNPWGGGGWGGGWGGGPRGVGPAGPPGPPGCIAPPPPPADTATDVPAA
ncbi:MAG: hypothetical protein ACRC46_04280 [Thermoguttaceae bacterium]